MYHIKHNGAEIAIEDNNVYTRCGQCRQEMVVDLGECVQDGALDLYGTTWYCEDCSYTRALQHRGESWAESIIKNRESKGV